MATVGPVTPNPALRQNFHIQLAQSTSQGLLFALPGPEDVAVGALLLTAPGKVLAEVVAQGGQKLLGFADGVVAPVGSAEAKLLAEARVRNNFYADGGVADPSRAISPLGDWQPAPMISVADANVMIGQRLPQGARVTEVTAASKANADVLAADALFKPPYIPNTQIVTVQTTQPESFVRVYVEEANKSRMADTWMMRAEDIKGLAPEQIASKYALPQVPTHIADVSVPAGTSLQASVANDVQINQGLGGNGGGGGVQFEVLSRPSVDADFERWFTNPRRLP